MIKLPLKTALNKHAVIAWLLFSLCCLFAAGLLLFSVFFVTNNFMVNVFSVAPILGYFVALCYQYFLMK